MYAPDIPGRIIAVIPKKPVINTYQGDTVWMELGAIFVIWYEIKIPIKSEKKEIVFF